MITTLPQPMLLKATVIKYIQRERERRERYTHSHTLSHALTNKIIPKTLEVSGCLLKEQLMGEGNG
jgi:Zn-dependent peptidase ImmA (M78 family)